MRTLLLASALVALSIPLAGSSQTSQPAESQLHQPAGNSPVGIWRKVEDPVHVTSPTLTITSERLSFVDGSD
jgi:hypothetical protein